MYILLGIALGIFFVFMPIFYAIFGIEVALIITGILAIIIGGIIIKIGLKKSNLIQDRNKMTKNILKKDIPEKFKSMYRYVYDNYGATIENYRKKLLIRIIIASIFLLITGILYITIINEFNIKTRFERKSVFYIFIPAFLYMTFIYKKYNYKYQKEYKENIVKNFISILPYKFSYKNIENNILQQYYDDANFTNIKYKKFISNDYLEGMANNVNVQISDIVLEENVYKGIFSVSMINQILPQEVRIKTKKSINKYENDKVEVDDMRFAKYFDVFSKSKVLALEILTHDVMEEMVQYFETNKINFEIVMKENRIYIRYNIGDIFEGEVLRKSTNIKSLWIFYNMTRFTIELAVKMNTILEEKEI